MIRSTLDMNDSFDVYENSQSSSGPVVTLTVVVQDCKFNIDLVGSLAFHTDKWWVADKARSYFGFWNAIPKPIKLNALPATENVVSDLQNINPKQSSVNVKQNTKSKETGVCNTSNQGVQHNHKEGKKIPVGIRYSKPKTAKIIGDAENVTPGIRRYRKPPSSCHWFRKPKKPIVKGEEQLLAPSPSVDACNGNIEKSFTPSRK